jgi:putative inorganic carbon (HCO3(-)) transporter
MGRKLIIAGVCLLVFFRPLVSGMTYPWSNTCIQTMLLVICAAWLIRTLWKKSAFFRTPLDVPLITFFLCLTVSALRSVNSAVSLNHMYGFMTCVLLYFIITNNIKTRREQRAVILALYFSVTLVCFYGIYQYFWGLDSARRIVSLYHCGEYPPEFIARLATEKAFSTFVYPPALAGFLVLVMPLSLSICLWGRNRIGLTDKTRFSRILYVPAFAGVTLLILSCLTLTFSKAGWLSALLSMVVFAYIWFAVIRRMRKSIVISVLLIPIVIFVLLLVSGCMPKVTLSGFAGSFSVRLGYWKAVPSMVKDYPFLGSGPATFGTIYPAHRPLLAHETQMAHNNYLQVLVETGIAGFMAFMWLWARFLRRGIQLIKGSLQNRQKVLILGYFAGVVGFLIQSLVDFGLYIHPRHNHDDVSLYGTYGNT